MPGDVAAEALPRVLVDEGEQPERAAVVRPLADEIVGPDVVPSLGAAARAGAIRRPQPPAARGFTRDPQPLLTPEWFCQI